MIFGSYGCRFLNLFILLYLKNIYYSVKLTIDKIYLSIPNLTGSLAKTIF